MGRVVSELVILDFDGTILNTEQFKAVQNEFWNTTLARETVEKLNECVQAYRQGEAKVFSPNQQMSDSEWEQTKLHAREHVPELLFPDATEFIKGIDADTMEAIILTFGNEEFQKMKILASELSLPVIYTGNRNKAAEIASWWRDGFYVVNDGKFSKIVLIDDRQHSFDDFGALSNARGFLLNREGSTQEIGAGDLPKNVKNVQSFREIVLQ